MWRRLSPWKLSPWTRVYIVAWAALILLNGVPAVYALYVLWEPCQCEPGG